MTDDLLLGKDLTCFIVSPIGNRLEPIGSPGRARYEESIAMWEEVFEPACRSLGMAPVRADRIADAGEIPDQIFTYLRDADVVVADLSHANPNVMYELGLRHSRADKITLQVGEYGLLPFDVTTIRTIQFNRTAAGLIAARNELTESLHAALRGGATQLRATSIFATESSSNAANISADVEKSLAAETDAVEPDEPGVVNIMAEGEEAITHVTQVLAAASTTITLVGALSKETGDKVADPKVQQQGFAGRLLIVRQLAEQLADPSDTLERLGNEFFADIRRLDVMVQYLIERFETGDEPLSEGVSFFTSIGSLIDSAEEGATGITTFRDGSKALSKTSRDLDPVAKTLRRGAGRFLEGIAMMSSWRESVESLLARADGEAA